MGLGPIFRFRPMSRQDTELEALLRPVISGLGYELWGIERLGGRGEALIRLYIDNEKGINLADCEAVSRQVSAVLDVEDPIQGSYTLEVSSPGTDRPLFNKAQFESYVGERVNLKLSEKINQKRKVSGYLEEVNDDSVIISIDELVYEIPLAAIHKANLIWQE